MKKLFLSVVGAALLVQPCFAQEAKEGTNSIISMEALLEGNWKTVCWNDPTTGKPFEFEIKIGSTVCPGMYEQWSLDGTICHGCLSMSDIIACTCYVMTKSKHGYALQTWSHEKKLIHDLQVSAINKKHLE